MSRARARGIASASVRIGIAFAAGVCLWASASLAQQSDSPLKSAMKLLGFATDVAPPADFVLQSRPKGDLDFIPIFQPPPEPAKPALNDKELKAVKGDLELGAATRRRASTGLSPGRPGGGRGGRGQESEDEACSAQPVG